MKRAIQLGVTGGLAIVSALAVIQLWWSGFVYIWLVIGNVPMALVYSVVTIAAYFYALSRI